MEKKNSRTLWAYLLIITVVYIIGCTKNNNNQPYDVLIKGNTFIYWTTEGCTNNNADSTFVARTQGKKGARVTMCLLVAVGDTCIIGHKDIRLYWKELLKFKYILNFGR